MFYIVTKDTLLMSISYDDFKEEFIETCFEPYYDVIKSKSIRLIDRTDIVKDHNTFYQKWVPKIEKDVINSGEEAIGNHYIKVNDQKEIDDFKIYSKIASIYTNENIYLHPSVTELTQSNTFGHNAEDNLYNTFESLKNIRELMDYNKIYIIPDDFEKYQKSHSTNSYNIYDDLDISFENFNGQHHSLNNITKLNNFFELNKKLSTFPASNKNGNMDILMRFNDVDPLNDDVVENSYIHNGLQMARLIENDSSYSLNYFNNLDKSQVESFKAKYNSKYFRNYLKEGPYGPLLKKESSEYPLLKRASVFGSNFNECLNNTEGKINKIKLSIKSGKRNILKYSIFIGSGITLNLNYRSQIDYNTMQIIDLLTISLVTTLISTIIPKEINDVRSLEKQLNNEFDDINSFFIDLKYYDNNKSNFMKSISKLFDLKHNPSLIF